MAPPGKAKALEELKRARQGGRRVLQEEDTAIYDEVTEDQYKKIVRGRLQEDDFVEDDGISGYMDNGMDEWEGRDGDSDNDNDEDSEQEERDRKKKAKKKQKEKESAKAKPKPKAKVQAKPEPAAPTISAYRPVVSESQEQDFLSSLLSSMTDAPAPPPRRSRKREYDESSSPPRAGPSYYDDNSSDGPFDDSFTATDDFMSPKKKLKTSTVGMTPAIERMSQLDVHGASSSEDNDVSFDDLDMDAFMDVDDVDLGNDSKPKMDDLKPIIKQKKLDTRPPAWLSTYESLNTTVEPVDEIGMGPSATARGLSSSNISALEPDGSLRFFWLDYLEANGLVYFIGKLKDKNTGIWISCCVTVEGIERNLFVLPRPFKGYPDADGGFAQTDIVPTEEDVLEDFEFLRKQLNIKKWRGKFVQRKYAFSNPDVPRGESKWFKVAYGFSDPELPENASSPSISKIFGANTSAFELLVVKRKIMGPCWLQIKNPHVEHKGVSWCKFEATVSDPKDINPFPDSDSNAPKEMPPLTVMSLSIRTIVNHQLNKREIVCATARTWHNMNIEDATPPESLPCTVQTLVRPIERFPPNFETQAKKNSKGLITPMKNERALLNSLLVTIYKADPDVIVGHDFLSVSLDVLLHRMKELKADHWSRISRFRRAKFPLFGKQGFNIKFLNGRMLCDLASDSARGMITSTTWSLTEMCKTHLKSDRQDIDPDDTASYLDGSVSSPDRLMTFVKHCELDAHYHMAIASKVQILPLTRQLTNLAGNSWNKTLNGGRAERNEYILLHEFHRLKYVCPDKAWPKKNFGVKDREAERKKEKAEKAAAVAAAQNPDDPAPKLVAKKRDKYKGGLVFEPKRGLWDRYILVMDFNSLYPSIIQEYNIDFTTVESVDDYPEFEEEGAEPVEEKMAEPPASDVPQGVLPRLIATLVNRRRAVKSLMKDRSASPAKLLQYDIKQQALKLTANSMYGCLGFEHSRFFARPLAALTTFKGREILMNTRELAESLSLDVVYGDTDSVFVNSNVTDLPAAMKISAEFKKAVNDRYRLLEIDLDGVFERLLLLQKKKYAALKVEEGNRRSTEIKGLDMKRREYCALSKTVSQYVLDQILSGEAAEVVVEKIHEYLTTVGQNVREGQVSVDNFIIFKRLGKNPEDYPDGTSQPHVQVALRIKSKGGNARAGDVISYLICKSEKEESARSAQGDRARHPDEYRKAGDELKLDYEFYLGNQVLPPIERLCDPIEGTDRARLAECLGLDPNRFRASVSSAADDQNFTTLDSLVSDKTRFRECVPFTVMCRGCQGILAYAPLNDRAASFLTPEGPICPGCEEKVSVPSLQTQLEHQIRGHITKYYQGWTVCNDPTCGQRTRMMRVYGRRCLRPGCTGIVTFEYSDAQLYTQLRYYVYLFDGAKADKASKGTTTAEEVEAILLRNGDFLTEMTRVVERYLNQSGRRWVDMSSLFSFMKV